MKILDLIHIFISFFFFIKKALKDDIHRKINISFAQFIVVIIFHMHVEAHYQ